MYFASSKLCTPSLIRALIVRTTVLPAYLEISLIGRAAVTLPLSAFASFGLVTVIPLSKIASPTVTPVSVIVRISSKSSLSSNFVKPAVFFGTSAVTL